MSETSVEQTWPWNPAAITAEEKARRLTLLTGLFRTYGIEADKERLRAYGNFTKWIPPGLYRGAVYRAVHLNNTTFVPSPGQLIDAALACSDYKRSVVTGEHSMPKWYHQMLGASKQNEKPREIGMRSGPETLSLDNFQQGEMA